MTAQRRNPKIGFFGWLGIVVAFGTLIWEGVRCLILKIPIQEGVALAYVALGIAGGLGLMVDRHFDYVRRLDSSSEAARLYNESVLERMGFRMDLIRFLIERGNVAPNGTYFTWISKRQEFLLTKLAVGVLVAPDPDYFGFANMIFEVAKKNIVSTSKVDPRWYDDLRCQEYIRLQKQKLLSKGIDYTRIFFYSKDDEKEKRKKLYALVCHHSHLGFKNIIVPTDDYGKEQDVALLDDGDLVLEATVGVAGDMPAAEISGCACYIGDENLGVAERAAIERISGYIHALPSRQHSLALGPGKITKSQHQIFRQLLGI
jgi:hypothetical protein